ncbi:SusC/RagA family TonB-linked outer membrane protein [Bacteroides xylanisolvens]
MKKKQLFDAFYSKCIVNLKLPLVMRISLVLLFVVLFQLSAKDGYAQRTHIAIKISNVTIEQVLNKIEETSDYVFLYNDNAIKAGRVVSVEHHSGDIKSILNDIFNGTDIVYSIVDKQIILSIRKVETVAQDDEIQLKGVVKDASGELLIGVSVLVKGTTNGTITGMDGDFSLKVKKGDVLVFSYVGYADQEVVVKNGIPLAVVMKEDTKVLDEVVVTALGIKRKSKALGYNLKEVKSDELTAAKDVNFVNSLAGKVAGLQINSSSGGVGGATKVVMRGAKSITKDNNVLYVIDGVPLYNTNSGQVENMFTRPGTESIADINPEDIESMSVLNGPSAAALYGSNAANGAILITTKKGQVGKAKVTLAHSTDFMKPFVTPRFQNTYGNIPGEYMSWGNKLDKPSTFDPVDFFRTGFNTTTTLSVSTGTEKNQTFISAASTNAKGIMPNNDYNRYNFTFRNTAKLFNDKLTVDVGAGYVKQNDQNPGTQGQFHNPLIPLYLFPRGEDFSKLRLYERVDESRNIPVQYWPYGDGGTSMQNPYWIINRNMFLNDKDRYMMNASLKWDIIPGLNIMGRVRLDNEYGLNEKKFYAGTSGKFAQKYGYYSNQKRQNKQTYADIIANLNKSFGVFDLTANVGASISDLQYNASSYYGHLKQIPNFFSENNIDFNASASGVSQMRWREQTQSIFASAELGYKSMVYLSATARNDWASQLANTEQPCFFYPSLGLSAIVTEMFDMPEWLTYLKLRGAYSQVGSPIQRNISVPTYPYNNDGVLQTITRYPIDKLYPEMTTSYEVGFDLRLFQNRFNIDFTYYKSNTKDQTFNAPISASTGYSTIIVQTGNVRNYGLEISLGYNDKFFDGLHWDSQLTFSLNRNKIMSLVDGFPDPITGEPIIMPELQFSKTGTYLMKLVKGGSIGDIYSTSRLYTDNKGDIYVDDAGKLGAPVEETFKVGNANPDFNLGFRNSFSYKGFDLGFLFTARVGGEVVSATEAALDNYGVSERSAIARDNGGVPVNNGMLDAQYFYQFIGGGETGMTSQYVYSATNIRLQELTLGYKLPKKWFNNLLDIKLSLVGRNLWMIYNKAPFDPEIASSTSTYYQGFDYFMLPSTRNIGFSVRIEY